MSIISVSEKEQSKIVAMNQWLKEIRNKMSPEAWRRTRRQKSSATAGTTSVNAEGINTYYLRTMRLPLSQSMNKARRRASGGVSSKIPFSEPVSFAPGAKP
jgi:hypothetical protein